ncbi:uncharacterized protein DEA37_0008478 [Paragonimus westermani]|uniref:Uncharacterized protein n=1 Tax=Paragonimus westermani TaxID=34504 RepID=A0A5J4P5I2_9TREM|nr:uncharacterized protein DEA37_0008478 [Paragonimus westermani]
MTQFLKDFENPGLTEFENKFQELKELGSKLEYLFELYIVGPLEIFTRKCIELFITQIQHMSTTIEDYDRTISRPISNLDDIFYVIDTLTRFHDREVSMDMLLVKAEAACRHRSSHAFVPLTASPPLTQPMALAELESVL